MRDVKDIDVSAMRERLRAQLRYGRALAEQLVGIHPHKPGRLDGTTAAILTYHRVVPEEQARSRAIEPGMYVTPSTFRKHLEWLTAEYVVLPLAEIVRRIRDAASLPERAVALTFDDGWRDFYQHAWPELKRAGVPATVFLVTDRVGTEGAFWPDDAWRRLKLLRASECDALATELGIPLHGDPAESVLAHLKRIREDMREVALKTLRRYVPIADKGERELLDWSEVEQLARAGIEFESHTRTHAICPGLPEPRLRDELVGSLQTLRERGLARSAIFAYPSGAYDQVTMSACADAGYSAALATRRGLASARQDPFALPRLGLHEDVSRTLPEFRRLVPGDTWG